MHEDRFPNPATESFWHSPHLAMKVCSVGSSATFLANGKKNDHIPVFALKLLPS